ncbi:MAG: hypothetical protein ACRD2R_01320, partial [Terriglobales bacterium]
MLLTIDSFDGAGARDYTAALDAAAPPRILRRLNQPAELRAVLVAAGPQFVVPAAGGRVIWARDDGAKLFTGHLAEPVAFEYLGWGERGPVHRYTLLAVSDEFLLDRKTLPPRPPFVNRTAGQVLKQLSEDLLPGAFATAAVEDLDTLPAYSSDPRQSFSAHAAELGVLARAACRAQDGALVFRGVGATTHAITESSPAFSPQGFTLRPLERRINDLTVSGRVEPRAYVKDYFLGDGLTLRFDLSHVPFTRRNRILHEEEFAGSALSSLHWTLADPAAAVSVSGGKLNLSGGTGTDGETRVEFVEPAELGGAHFLHHGEFTFSAPTDAVLGGLYSGSVSIGNCFAGFRVTPSGGQSQIRVLVSGAATGPTITTVAGHRYALTTRLYATAIFRSAQVFHSAQHPAGSGLGGDALAANVRIVLEVHDVDPATPGSEGML